jgi:hypothetical protein
MNEFGPHRNGELKSRVALREHPATDPISCFENCDGKTGTRQLCGGGEASGPCPNYDHIGNF